MVLFTRTWLFLLMVSAWEEVQRYKVQLKSEVANSNILNCMAHDASI